MSFYQLSDKYKIFPYYVINCQCGIIPIYKASDIYGRLKREGVLYNKDDSIFYSSEDFSIYAPSYEIKVRKAKKRE